MGPRPPLRIAAAQPECVPHEVERNAATHADVVRRADSRVVVFPEMSLTGYELDTPPIAAHDPRLATLVAACGASESAALVGAPILDDDGVEYIATLLVSGGGVRVAYRKVCLHGAEVERFAAGTSPARVDIGPWRFGLAICKDTSDVEHAARTAALGIDVYVASVLEHLDDTARTNDRAARIAADHRVWVVSSSFAGATTTISPTAGGSSIVDPASKVLVQASSETGELVCWTLV